jgi:cell division protein FtsB
MQENRNHSRSFFYSIFWILILLFFCVIFILSTINIYKKYLHAKRIKNEYHKELVQSQEKVGQLEKTIDNLSTDRGKETEIRDRYRVVKEGEQMILIVDNAPLMDTSVGDTESRNLLDRMVLFLKNL